MLILLVRHLVILALVFISPVFPPVFIPITYTLIGVRLLQGAEPITMSLATIVPATISTILIRLLYGYAHKKILAFKAKKNHNDRFSRIEKKFTEYIENKKRLNKLNQKITNHLKTKNSKLGLFLLTIVAIDSAIPDIVAIGIIRKSLPFPLFILATIIGKSIVYLPIIRGTKRILNIFGS